MNGTPGNNGPAINAVSWTLFWVAVVAVILRLTAKMRRKHPLAWDDYLMALSLVRQIFTLRDTSLIVFLAT